ncbi:flagellin [Roseobacteraceae bacterium NS-SX3]
MIISSYGDLAQHMFLRTRNAELQQDIATLSNEFATGKSADLTKKLGGDFTYLADIESTLNRLDSYTVANGEVQLYATSIQDSLGKIQSKVVSMRNDIINISPALDLADAAQMSTSARLELENSITTLNAWAGGRSLFSGTASDTSPLNGADVMMTELVTEVSGLTTASDIIQTVKDWFNDPAGFDAAMYKGSNTPFSPVNVGAGEQVSLSVKANDPELKHAMQSFAMLALINEPALSIPDGAKLDLVRAAGGELASSNDQLIGLQADVGFIEGQLERASARNEATKTSLSITKNNLVSADPFETYTKLEEAQTQLQSLYTVTARSAELSLLRYMS